MTLTVISTLKKSVSQKIKIERICSICVFMYRNEYSSQKIMENNNHVMVCVKKLVENNNILLGNLNATLNI